MCLVDTHLSSAPNYWTDKPNNIPDVAGFVYKLICLSSPITLVMVLVWSWLSWFYNLISLASGFHLDIGLLSHASLSFSSPLSSSLLLTPSSSYLLFPSHCLPLHLPSLLYPLPSLTPLLPFGFRLQTHLF